MDTPYKGIPLARNGKAKKGKAKSQAVCPAVDQQERTDANTITEAELRDNAKNGAVRSIKAVPVGKRFQLVVTLSWKEGDLLLITQKKTPRTWASVDRLINHIETNNSSITTLTIYLKGSKND